MRLARVDIKGFKSIAKKTVLSFPGQVTCICGPNGCGKSNVIDAIRWAIGEQSARTLRAGNMSDVIFAGTQETPQAGMARVTLEFSRDDGYWPASLEGFETIAVARRLYRTGESSYTINEVKCRLKDVADLFMDTGLTRHGYAIIGQGRIKDIIQAKPEDIRYLIEEAADVGRFRLKRSEALRRLEAASLNLERIQDLLGEVLKQRNALKHQAAKALRYQELREELNRLTLSLWSHELASLDARQRAADQEFEALQASLEELEHECAAASEARDVCAQARAALKRRLDESERAVLAARSELDLALNRIAAGQTRQHDINANLKLLEARIAEHTARLVQVQAEQNSVASGESQLEQELVLAQDALDLSQEALTQLEALHAERAADYDQRRAAVFETLGEQRACEQRLNAGAKRRQETEINLNRRAAEVAELDQTEAQLRTEQTGFATAAAALAIEQAGLRTSLAEIEQMAETAASASEAAQHNLVTHEKAEAALKAKLSVLARLLDKSSAQTAGPSLRGLIKPKPGFEQTVGRALGSALDYALVETHADIASHAACPGFIPREVVVSDHVELSGAGLIAPLHDCLTAENDLAARCLTQNYWVVADLNAASAIWRERRPKASLITLDGLVLEPSGVVRNTSARHGEILKAEADHAELAAQCAPLAQLIAEGRATLTSQREIMATCAARRQAIQTKLRETEREQQRQQAKAEEICGRLERLEARRQNFDADLAAWRELLLKLEQEQQDSLNELSCLNAALETRQESLKSIDDARDQERRRLEQARGQVQADSARLGELRVRLAGIKARHQGLQEEQLRRQRELTDDRNRQTELNQTAAAISAQLDEAGQDHARLADLHEQRLTEQAGLNPQLNELEADCASRENGLNELDQRQANLKHQHGQLLLKRKEYEISRAMRLERLQARFESGPTPLDEDFVADAARNRATELQTIIESLGQINFTSIEAHEEAQNRYEEIQRQYEDLIQATAKLKEVIQSCERESNKAFMATFVKVRCNFQEIFTTMFDGGRADLVLEDSDEAGVEIFACPPHKKPKTMSLLSEGEKTLCALSFIFALFKVKPSPFCVMDEVDAPLDDANVERMLRLIRTFANDTQFLVVTHNRRTMEMADVIYGVTFDVPGITKLISLNLTDAADHAA